MRKPIKITFVMNNLTGGGAERILVNVLNGLDREIYEPSLFLFECEGKFLEYLDKDIKLEYGVKKTFFNNNNIFMKIISNVLKYTLRWTIGRYKLKKITKNQEVLVAYLEKMTTYIVGSVSKRSNITSYSWIHTNLNESLSIVHKVLSKKYYKYYKKVFCVSNECKELAIKTFPELNDKIYTVYNPILINDIVEKSKDISKFKLPSGKNILAIGRLTIEKGFDVLIEAMSKIDKDNNLVILGEGKERESLQKIVKELELEDRVFLPGFVDNPYSILKQSDLFVLSSRIEGLPSVLIEALALNKRIVSTKCSGSREILEDGKYGYLAEVEDSEDLAEKINIALKDDLSINGLNKAIEFEKDIIMKQIEDMLKI